MAKEDKKKKDEETKFISDMRKDDKQNDSEVVKEAEKHESSKDDVSQNKDVSKNKEVEKVEVEKVEVKKEEKLAIEKEETLDKEDGSEPKDGKKKEDNGEEEIEKTENNDDKVEEEKSNKNENKGSKQEKQEIQKNKDLGIDKTDQKSNTQKSESDIKKESDIEEKGSGEKSNDKKSMKSVKPDLSKIKSLVKKVFKSKKILAALVLAFIFLVCFLSLAVLAFLKPSFEVSFVENKFESQLEDIKIGGNDDYPTIESPEKMFIKVNDKEIVVDGSYQFVEGDLQEGENRVIVTSVYDYFLVRFISQDQKEFIIELDTTGPNIEFSEETTEDGEYLVLEPVEIVFDPQDGDKIVVNEEEFTISELESYSEESNKKVFQYTPQDGESTLQTFLIDSFGNRGESRELKVNAFQKTGFARKSCNGIVFPLNNDLRFGVKGFRDPRSVYLGGQSASQAIADFNSNAEICTKDDMSYQIYLKSDAYINCMPCGGPGIVSDSMYFGVMEDYHKDWIAEARKNKQIIDERDVTAPQGHNMKYIKIKEVETMVYEGTYYTRYYIFDHKGKQYVLRFHNEGKSRTALSDYMVELANSIKLEK